MSLGEELRSAREKAGLSQDALAHAAGLDRSNLAELETDKKWPNLETLFRITEALDVSAAKIIANVEKEWRATRRRK